MNKAQAIALQAATEANVVRATRAIIVRKAGEELAERYFRAVYHWDMSQSLEASEALKSARDGVFSRGVRRHHTDTIEGC